MKKKSLNFSKLTPAGKVRRVKEYAVAVVDTVLTAVCYAFTAAAVWLVWVAFFSIF